MGKAAAIPAIAGGVSALAGGGGGGKKGGKGGAEQTVTNRLDPQAEGFRNQVFQRANEVSKTPFQGFGGERIAGLDPATLAGFQNQMQQFGGLTQNLGLGSNLLQGLAGQSIEDRIGQFQNPFEQQVIQGLQGDFARQNQQGLNQLGAGAASQGAFGGTRQGVAEGTFLGEQSRNQSNQLGQFRQQGFNQSVQNAFQQQGQQQGLAGQLTNLGLTGLQGQSGAQLALGGSRQAVDQANRDFQFQEFMRQINQPLQNLQLLQQTLAGAPTGQTTTEFAQGNPFAGALGGAAQGIGLGGQIGGGGTLQQILGGLAGGLLGSF